MVELAPPGRDRTLEDARDLLHRSVLVVEEHDDGTLLGGECGYRVQQLDPSRVSGHRCWGSGAGLDRRPTPAPPSLPLCVSEGNPTDPEIRPLVPADLRPVLQELDERVLGDLLGYPPVPDHVGHRTLHRADIPDEEVVEPLRVAARKEGHVSPATRPSGHTRSLPCRSSRPLGSPGSRPSSRRTGPTECPRRRPPRRARSGRGS